MAASGGLFPLASGVIEAICDFRLEGTLPAGDGLRGGGFFGAGCKGTKGPDDAEGCGIAGGSEWGAGVGGATTAGAGNGAEPGDARVPPPAGPLTGWTVSGVDAGTCVAEGVVWSLGVAFAGSACTAGSAFAPMLFGFLIVGSTTGTTWICEGSVVASGIVSATCNLYSSPARPKSSCAIGASTGATGWGFSHPRSARCPPAQATLIFGCQGAWGAATIAQAARTSAAKIAPLNRKPDRGACSDSLDSPAM